jgi:predicted amidophosphoribosyltransferase
MAFILLGFMGVIVAFAVVAAFLPRPTRECPQCAGDVRLTAPRCTACGYQFAPDGSSRYIR